MSRRNNYAFIDSQNLNLGVQKLGWKLDYRKFRVYLAEKYDVVRAYVFIGFVHSNKSLYKSLQDAGFVLKFKPTTLDRGGRLKGNVDADLVLSVVLERDEYEKAVVVSSDGDFYSFVSYLRDAGKLRSVISPDLKNCSRLLRQSAQGLICFMDTLREKLEYKRKTPPRDETRGSVSL